MERGGEVGRKGICFVIKLENKILAGARNQKRKISVYILRSQMSCVLCKEALTHDFTYVHKEYGSHFAHGACTFCSQDNVRANILIELN